MTRVVADETPIFFLAHLHRKLSIFYAASHQFPGLVPVRDWGSIALVSGTRGKERTSAQRIAVARGRESRE